MRAFFLLAVSIFFINISFAQKAALFPAIEKLLNASQGEKVSDEIGYWIITRQKFSKTLISEARKDYDDEETTWVTEHKNMDWESGFDYDLIKLKGRSTVSVLRISFEKPLNYWYYATDDKDKGDKEETDTIDLFFLTKDYDKMEELMDEFIGYN